MQENETKKFDQKAYIQAYNKEKYKNMQMSVKPEIFERVTNFCKDVQISRTEFLINCALYIIEHDMLDDIRAYKPRED